MGRSQAHAQSQAGGTFPAHQERALTPPPAVAAAIASERVRSTVASLETNNSTQRLLTGSPALAGALAAPAQRLALAGPNDARGQLRYLHHRVSGVAATHSREMLR
jgi:hypothetical protein